MKILEIFRTLDFDLLKFYLLKIFIIINSIVYIRIRNFYLSLYNISYNSGETIEIKWKNMELAEYRSKILDSRRRED